MIMCPRCGSVLEMRENRRNEIIKTLNAITDRELADAFAVIRED